VVSTPTLDTLARDLASGARNSRSLVEECLAQIEDVTGEGRRTYIHVDREAALAQASALDALRASDAAPSRYAGIPISIKDLFDIAGQVTRAGSIALSDAPPAASDAACVARLRRAGFVLIGRTNMTEFAFSGLGLNPHYGTPLNPWHRREQRIPGGSSSGAAVSVTDGMAHAAIGTDTGGSCRIPAAFSGLVGYKPTARKVPQQGMIPLSPSLDSVGPLARSVSCCALLHALLADEPVAVLTDTSVSHLRFAVPCGYVLDQMDSQVATDYERALRRIAASGAQIEQVEVPEFAEIPAINAQGTLSATESFAWHRRLLPAHAAQYDPRVLSRIQAGASQSAADYSALLEARKRFIARVESRLAKVDALLMPTVPVLAPRMTDLASDAAYYRINALVLRNPSIINFLDGCAISIPIHDPGAAPVGLTLASRHGSDAQVLRCAAAIERLFDRKHNS
jgi:aspartyl-tRNA(Asn)/glutamyl-tRNA(Gln) amidotransferase subunit A